MAGNSGAIRAGRAFVELFSKDTALQKGLAKAKKDLQSFSRSTAKVGGVMGGAGATVLAPLTAALGEALGKGDKIQTLADKYQESTDSVSKLAYAFERMGGSLEDADSAVGGLQARIKAAADGNSELIDGLRGLNGRKLIGMGLDEQLDAVAEKIKSITNVADQNSVIESLGLSQLGPVLKKGKAGLDEMRAAAEQAGAVMSPEDTARSKETMQAYNATLLAVKNTFIELGAALLPSSQGIKDVSGTIQNSVRWVRDWIKENKSLIIGVALVGVGLVAAGAAVLGLSAAAGVASAGIGLLSGAITVLGGIVGFVLSPAGLVIAGIAGGIALILHATGSLPGIFSAAGGAATAFGDRAKSSFNGIVSAFKAGDIQLAWDITCAYLDTEWKRFVLLFQTSWKKTSDFFTDIWYAAVAAFKIGFKQYLVSGDIWSAMSAAFSFSLDTMGAEWVAWFDKMIKDLMILADFTLNPMKYAGMALDKFTSNHVTKEGAEPARDLAKEFEDAMVEKGVKIANMSVEGIREEMRLYQADARNKTAKGVAAAADSLGIADARLQELLAKAKGLEGVKPGDSQPLGSKSQTGPRLPTGPELMQSMKGIFGGAMAAQQLGRGDTIAKRQLDAAETTARNTAELPALNDQMKDLKRGLQIR